mmetsp:Transcript_459/g.913  ORF Transcript_459/g.913 Transcript_459/m.913 type:complete len:101 (-) Transcript_459:210-512(-)
MPQQQEVAVVLAAAAAAAAEDFFKPPSGSSASRFNKGSNAAVSRPEHDCTGRKGDDKTFAHTPGLNLPTFLDGVKIPSTPPPVPPPLLSWSLLHKGSPVT